MRKSEKECGKDRKNDKERINNKLRKTQERWRVTRRAEREKGRQKETELKK